MNKTPFPALNWPIQKAYDFPHKAFHLLHQQKFLQMNVPSQYSDTDACSTKELLDALTQVGAVELSVGRIYEGHINAIELIKTYGTKVQQEQYFREAVAGKLFGIWNTDDKTNPVGFTAENKLNGSKIFCSGGLSIDRPIITAISQGKPQMLVIHTEAIDTEREDFRLWNPMGMKASRSTKIDFTGYEPDEIQVLGAPGDYELEPQFSTGAIRFAAVQMGGAQAMAYTCFEHLYETGRSEDPYQRMRMGQITMALESGRNWLDKGAQILDDPNVCNDDKINFVNMLRSAVLDVATQIMHLAEKSVGLSGMMEDHKLEQIHRDLSVYLKQPGPDRALAQVGAWSANPAHWKPRYS